MAGVDVQRLGSTIAKHSQALQHASRVALRLHPNDEEVQQQLEEHAKGAAERTKLIEEVPSATLTLPRPAQTANVTLCQAMLAMRTRAAVTFWLKHQLRWGWRQLRRVVHSRGGPKVKQAVREACRW